MAETIEQGPTRREVLPYKGIRALTQPLCPEFWDQEGERKRIAADVSKLRDDIRTGVSMRSRDEPGGCPLIGQVVSGMQVA